MALPNSKQELADWILRRLGAPMTNIEIADVQLEDVIDEAVQFFQEFHYDGAERTYRVIKIEEKVLEGNNRRHQDLNAPMYDPVLDHTYRLGDRIMTYKPDNTPDRIWVKYDSDQTTWFRRFTKDAFGEWFVFASDLSNRDDEWSLAEGIFDSDNVYITYDSDLHTTIIYYPIELEQKYYIRRESNYVPDSEISWIDSEGSWVLYDSDKHANRIYSFDYNVNGLFVLDSDSVTYLAYDSDNTDHWTYSFIKATDSDDLTNKYVLDTGIYVLYDSDVYATSEYYPDSEGNYVREEGIFRFVTLSTDPVYEIEGTQWFSRKSVRPQLYDRVYVNVPRFSRKSNLFVYSNQISWVDSDGTYVLFDSEKHFTYVADVNGDWVQDSENNYVPYDSTLHDYVEFKDSDGIYIQIDSDFYLYDSDKHNSFVFDSDITGNYVRVNGVYFVYDSDTHTETVYDSDVNGAWVIDSDGNYALYDSDLNVYKIHTPDANGDWVWDSDTPDSDFRLYNAATDIGLVRYKREDVQWQRYSRHDELPSFYRKWTSHVDRWVVQNVKPIYVQDSEGEYLYDSDTETYVLYDSDTWTIIRYDSDNTGAYIDSDGVYVQYNSSLYFTYAYDSEYIRVDSDGSSRRKIDSEGDLVGLYVRDLDDSEGYQYELYDSEKHSSLFYESDGLGVRTDFGINLDLVFRRSTVAYTPGQRFSKNKIVPDYVGSKRYKLVNVRYTRYAREYDSIPKFYREIQLLGERFSEETYRNVRVIGSEWNDYWKEEDKVLTEPVLDYDYSKVGQVGIPVPDTIIGVNKVFRIDNFSGYGMWNYEYQYFLNNWDFFYSNGGGWNTMPMTNYYITKSYLDLIDHMMNVQPAIRFNKHRNRLYIDTNWTRLNNMARSKDYYLMIECYEVNDPETFGDVYKDKWLKRYATALAKMQWGSNLKKYQNTELPGGLVIDGQALYEEGKEEAEKLEEELRNSQLEMDFIIG